MRTIPIFITFAAAVFAVGTVSAQRVTVDGSNRIYIDCSAMPSGAVKTMPEVINSKSTAGNGSQLKRHTYRGTTHTDGVAVNDKVSPKFEIAKNDINTSGETSGGTFTMTWAVAAGWDATAGTGANNVLTTVAPVNTTGCAAYGGSTGAEQGQWRLPTQREYQLMWVLKKELEAKSGFNAFTASDYYYWSATEHDAIYNWSMAFGDGNTNSHRKTTDAIRVRCVRDYLGPIYTVRFLLDGGTYTGGGALLQTNVTGTAVIVPNNPTKAGNSFSGWSPSPQSTIGNANVTYTAQWTAITSYNITYVIPDGLEKSHSMLSTFTVGSLSSYNLLSPRPYSSWFTHWEDQSGNKVTKVDTSTPGDKTYYARIHESIVGDGANNWITYKGSTVAATQSAPESVRVPGPYEINMSVITVDEIENGQLSYNTRILKLTDQGSDTFVAAAPITHDFYNEE